MTKSKKNVTTTSGILVAVSLAIGGSILAPKPTVENDVAPQIEHVAVVQQMPDPSVTPAPSPSTTPKPSPIISPKPTKAPNVEVKVEVTPTPAPLTTPELFGISGNTIVEGTYIIKNIDKIRSELSIDIPKSLSADLYEIYLNGQYVDKQLLPSGKIIAPPLIFTMPDILEVRIYKLQEVIAVATFKNDKLSIAVKDGVISE